MSCVSESPVPVESLLCHAAVMTDWIHNGGPHTDSGTGVYWIKVRKKHIILHFMNLHLLCRIQQIERGTNKLWPSVLLILSFTVCSVCSASCWTSWTHFNWVSPDWHTAERRYRGQDTGHGATAGCMSQAYCVIMEAGEREKEQHDQWTTQNGGPNLL